MELIKKAEKLAEKYGVEYYELTSSPLRWGGLRGFI